MKILLFLTILLITGCNNSSDIDVDRPIITDVEIARIGSSEVNDYYSASGTINAKTISDVSARIIGSVTSIQVIEGDKVIKDQVLLTIDDRDMTQKVVAAEEAFNESVKVLEAARQNRNFLNSSYKRYRELFQEKALTRQEMDEIETKYRVAEIEFERAQAAMERAKANLQESEINLEYTKIKSPVEGIVTQKKVEIGNTVVPGMVLITVEDNSIFRLEVMVDEKLFDKLKVGNMVEINISALDKNTKGRVSEILPNIDPATRSFLVKIDIDNTESLRTGLFARASIPYNTRKAILVPQNAIVQKGQLTGVYTVEDEGIVNYRLVKVGSSFSGGIEILSGLKNGDRIIVGGIKKVKDGGIIKNN